MATTRLRSIVSFVDVPAGGSVSLPHLLNWNGHPVIPDVLALDSASFDAAADATDVTVTNFGPAEASVEVLVWGWHTIERAFGVEGQISLSTRPFIIRPDPGASGAAGRMYLPEVWTRNDLAAGLADSTLEAQVSQLFDEFRAIRPGSIVAIGARLTAAVAAGDVTAEVTVNGVPSGFSVTIAAPDDTGQSVQPAGVLNYVQGDLLGVVVTTDAGLLPDGELDIEAVIQVDEG